jgi:uncharacterized zinc-type alcohol dehydrogenase-like protein
MLENCAEKKIYCENEIVTPEQINEAHERAIASDVKYRFSIDCAQLRSALHEILFEGFGVLSPCF